MAETGTTQRAAARTDADRAELEESLRRQSDELARQIESQRRLLEINARLLSTLDPAGVLDTIADGLKAVVRYDNLGVYRVDNDARVLRPVLARDRHAEEVLRYPIPFGRGLMNWAVSRRRPLLANDALKDPRAITIPDTPSDPEAIIVVPLIFEDEVLGALNIGRVGGEEVHFSQQDFELVQLFAGQAAVAVANARLVEELQASERRYRDLVDNSPDIVWSVDAEGRFVFLSDSLEPRTGWRHEQLIGRHFTEVTQGESRSVAQMAFERLRDRPEGEQRIRIELQLADGSTGSSEITMIGRVSDGRFAGAHGSVRDLSEREQLEASLRQQAAELAASEERGKLARELHDSVTQALFSMGLTIHSMELLIGKDPEAVRQRLAELRELRADALKEMRTLIFELRPPSVEQEGVVQALRGHAQSVQDRTGLDIRVEGELPVRPTLSVEEALFRIAQEALHNVVKHANASTVRITFAQEPGGISLSVTDDGVGFDPDNVPSDHLGLLGMRSRADRMGARLLVTSRRGAGSEVRVSLPEAAVGVNPAT
jgi:PAS domain S-box-containing protein